MSKYVDAYNSMGETGNTVIDSIFMACVMILVDIGDTLGVSYELLNIILFVVVHPVITLAFIALWVHARFVRCK